MKNLFNCLLLALFSLGVFNLTISVKADFIDSHGISSSKAIGYLAENDFVEGYGDGTFQPDREISRAEFLKIALEVNDDFKTFCDTGINTNQVCCESFGYGSLMAKCCESYAWTSEDQCVVPDGWVGGGKQVVADSYCQDVTSRACVSDCKAKIVFNDIDINDWYYPYVCFAVNQDIINGYPDGTFKPHNSINYVEAAKIIAKVEDLNLTQSDDNSWYAAFKEALLRERVVPGTIIANEQNITRGEMAQIIWGLQTGYEVENTNLGDLPELGSCADLSAQIQKYQKRNQHSYNYGRGDFMMEDMIDTDGMMRLNEEVAPTMEKSTNTDDATGSEASSEYSTTNIQEFGVDEADIIKNDGSHIFMIKDNTVRIVKAYPADQLVQEAVIKVQEGDFYPTEMFLDDNFLTVIGTGEGDFYAQKKQFVASMMIYPPPMHSDSVKVFVFDVADRKQPEKIRSVTFEGSYLNSRKIDDIVYLVINKYNYYNWGDPVIMEDNDLPVFRDSSFSDEQFVAKCPGVQYFPNFGEPNYLIIAAIDTGNVNRKVNRQVLLGSGSEVYASAENLFITRQVYDEIYWEKGGDSGWSDGEFTEVFKFGLDGTEVDFLAKGKVEGRVINQFAMSEHNDHFRIATQKGNAWGQDMSSSGVTVLDDSMEVVGKVEGIAPGEDLKSARFMGNRAYLVTFKTVDPLFVIDLADPKKPQILGKLKIPGWSDYLHPYDENHLIGFGKEVDESIDADKIHSDSAVYYTAVLGMKLAIFDVSDVSNPLEIHKEVIGYRGTTSELLNNHKALLFDKNKGILAFPITVTAHLNQEHGYDAQIDTVFSGAYVYDIDLEEGFKLRGKVSHYENDDYYKKSGEYFYGNNDFNIQRMIYIGEHFYSISLGVIKALGWNDLKEKGSLVLP